MNIKGLDYNTGREQLVLPEYGREIQNMVNYAIGLPDKGDRMKCARTIVRLMLTKVPHIRENADYRQTLWDHLYIMSAGRLDIDWPYNMANAAKINDKPNPVPLPQNHIQLRHYGRLVAEVLERLKTMPEGKDRDLLVRQTANQMKRDLLTWGHGSTDDAKVADDLARLTDGRVQLNLKTFKFDRVTALPTEEPKKGRRKK